METTGQIFRHAFAHGKVKRNPAQDFRPSDVLKATRKTNYARIDEKELHLIPFQRFTRFDRRLGFPTKTSHKNAQILVSRGGRTYSRDPLLA
jgi:hypothetical protein